MRDAEFIGHTPLHGASAFLVKSQDGRTLAATARHLVGPNGGVEPEISLAGLNGVPTELYDAAKIDGAGAWAQMRHITLPMVSPVIFYSLTLGVVGVLQFFLVPFILKNGTGEPGGTTLFYNLYIYKNFFTFQHMSYGATLAWVLFLLTLVITVGLFASARRWVYYAGER